MAKSDASTTLEVTSRYSLPQRRNESIIYLSETEQERLRGLINNLSDGPNWWEIALGIFASTALSFWASYFFFLPENTPDTTRMWVFAIACTTTGLTLASIFFRVSQKRTATSSKQAILDELDRISSQFQRSGDDEDQMAAVPALEILNAKYGTDEKSIDVTRRLANQVVDDKLDVPASNETAGEDPVPGVGKYFEIEYIFDGKTITVRFNEGGQIIIP